MVVVKKRLIVIEGPTGAGKTALSIALAKHFNTEVISADSRQIYQGMTIGTAAIKPEEMQGVPHHFVGVLPLDHNFNAFEYEKQALALIEQRFALYDHLILCGGSMLYIDAVCKGIDEMPDVDLRIRESLKKRVEVEGLDALLPELAKADPIYYAQVDKKNPARVVHGLEVFLTTGKPISSFRKSAPKQRAFDIVKVGLDLPREELYDRINRRVDKMLEEGLLDEVKSLLPWRECNALKTVGYREFFDYFDGKIDLEEAIRLVKRNSRRYAKKQLTWFRKDGDVHWFSPDEVDAVLAYLS